MNSNLATAVERQIILVTGPARSGKSEWAEALAQRSGLPVTYVATALLDPTDREWQRRIEQHRLRRPATWETVAVPIELAATIQTTPSQRCFLVDSLGTWLANLLEQDEMTWQTTLETLLHSVQQSDCTLIFVAEEVGWGVVPSYPIGRRFRDRLGMLTRHIGAIATPTYLVTAGQVMNLSRIAIPLATALNDPSATL